MAITQLDQKNIEEIFKRHRDEILLSLNPREIFNYLRCYLVKPRANTTISEMLENEMYIARSKCAEEIISAIEATAVENGPEIYCRFLQCVEMEPNHMGHKYITKLLRGEEESIQSDPQVCESQRIQKNMSKCMYDLEDINIGQLIPHLKSAQLLTPDELKRLTSTDGDKIQILKNLLDTKGPKAHYIFAQCLESEDEHPTHYELYIQLTTGGSSCEGPKKRKRTHSENCDVQLLVVKAPRRSPTPLSAEELSSTEYLGIMTDLRKMHLMGKWEEAEKLVWDSMTLTTLSSESKVAIKLESCTGFISRRMEAVVISRVKEAQIEVDRLDSESNSIDTLLGRCEWVLAKVYRYVGKLDEAKAHIQEAATLQFPIERGEDTALTNYCHACILLERLTLNYSKTEANRAQKCFERAIEDASRGDYGLDLSHPHIRLAQLCLGSSPTQPGCLKDEQGLEKANSSLNAVKYKSLAPRTKCIYCYTKSDLHRNRGENEKATELAEMAMGIAREHGFTTEIKSVECRLAKLAEQK